MIDGSGPKTGSGSSREDAASPAADMRQLAQDWIDVWQSELAAIAADRETQETWQAMAGLWAGLASAFIQAMPRGHPVPGAHDAGAADAPRAAPVATAPDPRDAEVERLSRHIAALEARLAELERHGDHGRPARRTGARKR